MIVLDTTVLPELVRAFPDPGCPPGSTPCPSRRRRRRRSRRRSRTTRSPGRRVRRRVAPHHAVRAVLDDDLRRRVEPFDHRAGRASAHVVADRERPGRPIGPADARIAAICRARGATRATRDTKDFQDTGIELADPWRLRRAPGRSAASCSASLYAWSKSAGVDAAMVQEGGEQWAEHSAGKTDPRRGAAR